MLKATYGTGCFRARQYRRDESDLDARVCSRRSSINSKAGATFALEGAIFMAGATVQWPRDNLGIIATATKSEALAAGGRPELRRVSRSGVSRARGAASACCARAATLPVARSDERRSRRAPGSTRSPSRPAICSKRCAATWLRAASLRHQPAGRRRHDCQCLVHATAGRHPRRRASKLRRTPETTALGAAYLAGQAAGLYGDADDLGRALAPARVFEPNMTSASATRATRDGSMPSQK